jgi:3-oxoacyl-[acyl-carrier protein] reductase
MSVAQSLAGKIALVTDGSRGVGPAIVQRLADEGAIVLFTHVADAAAVQELVALVEASGRKAVAIETQSTAQADLEAAITGIVARFGHIDILVIDAYFLGFYEAQLLALEGCQRPDVRGASARVEDVISRMRAGGRIIATAHDSAPGSRSRPSIRSRRIAERLSRGIAHDVLSRGITVNLVQSGELNVNSSSEKSDAASRAAHCGRKRSAIGLEVASLIAYLASEEAGFITGTALSADGGHLG